MAQTRYIEYLSDDDSFQFSVFQIGIIPFGLYRGFDFVATNDLFLTLNHGTTGYEYPKIDKALTPKLGVIKSKQGVIISEDDIISLQVNANATANPRIDLVVCEHKYEITTGGLAAEYFIIQGTPSTTPLLPILTDPKFQVVIGQLYLPANTSVLDKEGVIYTRSQLPELGNNNLQERYDILEQDFNTLNTTVSNFITNIQNQFNALNQTMSDWRDFYKPVMQFDGVYIEWKWNGEADTPLIWRDLAQGIIVDCSGSGTMEVRILEAQYLPNAEVWTSSAPTTREHNVLEFNTEVNMPVDSTFWINNREWIAPQTKNYRFLFDTLKLVCYKNVSYSALDSANLYPFAFGNPLVRRFWRADAETKNAFIRFELVKNANVVVFTKYHKFKIEDNTFVGDEILMPVIDEIIAVTAGDHFTWRVSTMPNNSNPLERIPEIVGFPAGFGIPSDEILTSQGNAAWVLKNHYQIEVGHWTIFGL